MNDLGNQKDVKNSFLENNRELKPIVGEFKEVKNTSSLEKNRELKPIVGEFKDFKNTSSYLENNSKELDEQSFYKFIPKNNGEWSGDPGNSKWKPSKDYIPKKGNPDEKNWETILDKYKIDSIPFKNGEPDFSEVSIATVEIDNFTQHRYGAGANFDQANEKLAKQLGISKEDAIKWKNDYNCTWHEKIDCKTMVLVPIEIHHNISHRGGISEIKNK